MVVGGTRSLDALVTPSHVKAHLVRSTLDVLFQALVYIFTDKSSVLLSPCARSIGGCWEGQEVLTLARLPVGHEAISSRTETSVAPRCVDTLVLTDIPHLTLVDV